MQKTGKMHDKRKGDEGDKHRVVEQGKNGSRKIQQDKKVCGRYKKEEFDRGNKFRDEEQPRNEKGEIQRNIQGGNAMHVHRGDGEYKKVDRKYTGKTKT